jgi:hypothetical protein
VEDRGTEFGLGRRGRRRRRGGGRGGKGPADKQMGCEGLELGEVVFGRCGAFEL